MLPGSGADGRERKGGGAGPAEELENEMFGSSPSSPESLDRVKG